MNLYRYDYETVNGRYERVKKDELYVWAAVNVKTGEVELDEVRQFDDDLRELVEDWEWRRFTLTLSPP